MTIQEQKQALCLQIWEICRRELSAIYPHLDSAFSALAWNGSTWKSSAGTDGETICCNPEWLLAQYAKAPASIRRLYLHMLLHCLFFHPFQNHHNISPLALDMAVEQIIECQKEHRLALPHDAVRENAFLIMGNTPLSPQKIEELLRSGAFPSTKEVLAASFSIDDHGLWPQAKNADTQRKWQEIAMSAGGSKRGSGRRGYMAGDGTAEITLSHRQGRDYRSFLRRFMVTGEEMELDTESFDLPFYHFSITHYGNLPMLEPLEYKEVNRLEELVIAIDTSGSCSQEMVSQFLSETYSILSDQENFFRQMKVYLIQCDQMIQSVRVIQSREDLLRCSENITIYGRGGTDFTPVFRYVEELREKKELKNLKALLYFSDGDGAWPREKPDYEVAFVFLKKSEKMNLAPPWAKQLVVDSLDWTVSNNEH